MPRIVTAVIVIALFGAAEASYYMAPPGGTGTWHDEIGVVAHAQEGHPLTGTWAGDWWTDAGERTHITMVLNWDGKAITGTLNPGPDQAPLSSVTLDPATWTVRIDADAKGPNGQPVRVVAEGKLEDIASYHRTLSGTWSQGTTKGSFKLTRD